MDIRRILASIDVFMSIYDATCTAIVKINDTSGIVYDFPICGQEVIALELESPNLKPLKKTFYVQSVSDIVQKPNNTTTDITLHLVSIDHMFGLGKLVEHGLKDTVSNMVSNVLKTVLNTDQSTNIEPSKGIEMFSPTGCNVWETIATLKQRAVSVRYNSPYLFFEDGVGYNFLSVEYLIEQKKKNNDIVKISAIPYTTSYTEDGSKPSLSLNQYRNVENFRVISKTNIASEINNGAVSSKTIVLDVLNKTAKTITTDGSSFSENIREPLDKKYNHQYSNTLKDMIKTPPVKYFMPFDSTNKSEFQELYGHRRMFTKLLNSIRVGYTMYGDTSINPGDLVYVQNPRTIHDESVDKQLTGNYIVSHIRHTIIDGGMMTNVEAVRFGTAEEIF